MLTALLLGYMLGWDDRPTGHINTHVRIEHDPAAEKAAIDETTRRRLNADHIESIAADLTAAFKREMVLP